MLNVRENASFSEVVGILENASVAAEGLESPQPAREKTSITDQGEAKTARVQETECSVVQSTRHSVLGVKIGRFVRMPRRSLRFRGKDIEIRPSPN